MPGQSFTKTDSFVDVEIADIDKYEAKNKNSIVTLQ